MHHGPPPSAASLMETTLMSLIGNPVVLILVWVHAMVVCCGLEHAWQGLDNHQDWCRASCHRIFAPALRFLLPVKILDQILKKVWKLKSCLLNLFSIICFGYKLELEIRSDHKTYVCLTSEMPPLFFSEQNQKSEAPASFMHSWWCVLESLDKL